MICVLVSQQDQDTVCQGSRFSRFFSGINGNKLGSDTSSMEDMLVPLGKYIIVLYFKLRDTFLWAVKI